MFERVSPGLDTLEAAEVSNPADMLIAFQDMKAPELTAALEDLTQPEQNQLYLHVLSLPEPEQAKFTIQFIRSYLWERISAETMLDAMFQAEMAPLDSVQHRLGSELASNFSYRFTFDNAATEEAVKNLVDSGDFFRLGVFLDTLLLAYRASHSAPNPNARTGNMRWLVANILEQPETPPLLKLRAEALLDAMENEAEYGPAEIYDDVAPFLLSDDTYGWVKDHRVYVIDASESEQARQLADEAQKIAEGKLPEGVPTEYEFGNLDMGGEFIPIPTVRTVQSQLYQQTSQLAMEPLSPAELVVVSQQDELSDQDMYDFAYILSRPVRQQLEAQLGVPLSELSLPAQYRFLQFIKQHPNQSGVSFDRVVDFARTQGADGLQAFLALAHGGKDVAQTILNLNDQLQSGASDIFKRYGDIVREAENLPPQLAAEAHQFLYQKGVELLKKGEAEQSGLGQLLEMYQARIVALGAIYRSEREDIKDDLELKLLTREELANYRDTIIATTLANRPFLSEEEKEVRKHTLEQSLENPSTHFFAYEQEGKLLAFMSFANQSDGMLLIESLNVAPVLKGGTGLGADFFRSVVKELGESHELVGYVHRNNAGLLEFYESLGFVVSDQGSTDSHVEIIRPRPAVMQSVTPLAKAA